MPSLAQKSLLLFGGQSLTNYLLDLNAQGYVAAMYLADEITQATYTGTFAGPILRNAAYTSGAGAELVTNGGFGTGDFTGWTKDGAPTTYEVTGGRAHIVATATLQGFEQTLACVNGSTYLYSFDYEIISGQVQYYGPGVTGLGLTGTGTISIYAINTGGATPTLKINSQAGAAEFYIDNISIKQVGQLDAAIGGTTPWLAGGGLSFDGLTSYCKVLSPASLQALTDWAFAMIGTPTTLGEGDDGALFAYNSGVDPDPFFVFRVTNRMESKQYATGADMNFITANNEVTFLTNKVVMATYFDNSNVLGNGRKSAIKIGRTSRLSSSSIVYAFAFRVRLRVGAGSLSSAVSTISGSSGHAGSDSSSTCSGSSR